MDVEESRIKPWEDYETTLLTRGFVPRFEQDGPPLPVTCCRSRTASISVVMSDATTTLTFVVCPPCGDWIGRAVSHPDPHCAQFVPNPGELMVARTPDMGPELDFSLWAARVSNPARRIKSPELYPMS
jgi:hypothetical protein